MAPYCRLVFRRLFFGDTMGFLEVTYHIVDLLLDHFPVSLRVAETSCVDTIWGYVVMSPHAMAPKVAMATSIAPEIMFHVFRGHLQR